MDLQHDRLVAGRYRLLSPLGAGGMGTVWRGRDELLGREVAVKEVLFPRHLSEEDREVLRERTRREARAAARLDHPSAVTVYDVVQQDGAPYLVMELVEARTLADVVRTDGPLSPQHTARVGLALLGALETAHRQGIVHRDVKPGNVLLGPDTAAGPGRVVLTDFGIASTAGDASITSTGLLLGSPSYIAPERARGQSPAPASDLWSLGATLFTAVEGRPPYDGGDPLTTVTAVVTGQHEPFLAAGPLVPLLEGLLERDPAQRLSAERARAQLLHVANSPPTTAVSLPRPDAAAERRADRTTVLPVQDLQAAVSAADRRPSLADELLPDTDPDLAAVADEPSPRALTTARRRRSRAPVVLLAAILVVAGAIGAYLVSAREPGTRTTTSASPSAAPSPTSAPLPEGWTRYEDAAGWSVGVPPGYVSSDYRDQVQLRNQEQRRTLRVDALPAGQTPGTVLTGLAGAYASQLDDYSQVRLEPITYRGGTAVELEFTWFAETELQVVNRAFEADADERVYTAYWQTNARDFAASLPVFEQMMETFQPAG